jgi:feruloyl esterase
MRLESSLLLSSASLALALPPAAPQPSCTTDSTPNSFNATCAGIASKLDVHNGVVNFAEFVPAGTNLSLAENDPSCGAAAQLVAADMCRVGIYVSTSEKSGFNMEAWLPSNWTGRFLSGGELTFECQLF